MKLKTNAVVLFALALAIPIAATAAESTTADETKEGSATMTSADLTTLSLEDLMNLKVSTVSRGPERWWTAPSGVDVVTDDDIRRAGAQNLPDALRLATGVHVAQPSARNWAISIRGMNVLAANKVSVVMDGRNLYTPFFSGVEWDAQDTLMEDVDRIEVVRGPVGALWGAFAVNGLIQILTKPAWDTQGLLVSAGAGTEDPGLYGIRYGGTLGSDTYYRVYAKYLQTSWTYAPNGTHAEPVTDFGQSGFRIDSRRAHETTLTVQGDVYTNQDLPRDRLQTEISGGNVLGRWSRAYSTDSDLELEAYVDHTYRLLPAQFEEKRTSEFGSVKYRHRWGRHAVVMGTDALLSSDTIGNFGFALLLPGERTTHTIGVYAQDTFELTRHAALVFGAKTEQNSFSGFDVAPTLRFAYTPTEKTTAWAAVSRPIRPPVRIDDDLVIRFNGVTLFAANDDFKTETAVAYEAGVRHRPTSALAVDASVFAYRYDDLRSTEPTPDPAMPATFENLLDASSYGAELGVIYQPLKRLFFRGSYRYLELKFSKDPASKDTTNGSAEGNDPKHMAVVGGHLTLPTGFELDVYLRLQSRLPNPPLDGYTTMDARLGWRPHRAWEIALIGRNLLDARHAEFVTTNSLNEQVHRSVTLKVTWRR